MTTSHRPTWTPAVGNSGNLGFQSRMTSAKDQIGHTKIKYRQFGQASKEELKQRDFAAELERKEFENLSEKNKLLKAIENEEQKVDTTKLIANYSANKSEDLEKYDDADATFSNDDFSDSSDEEDDEDDDELELQRELEKIKNERAAAKAKKEAEEREAEEMMNRTSALQGNPLLNLDAGAANAKVKRKWNDDVVFRNQAQSEPESKKRFINDTIRNDFHRSFLKKYIR